MLSGLVVIELKKPGVPARTSFQNATADVWLAPLALKAARRH